MKILIVKRDKLGDLLLTTPMLRVLRQALPDAQIHLLANTWNQWVVTGNPDIDRVWVYRRVKDGKRFSVGAAWHQLVQGLALRRQQFDWVVVGNGEESHRAIRRALWLGGRRTVAYCHDASDYPGLTDPLMPDVLRHEARQLAGLLEPLGVALPATLPAPRYYLPRDAAEEAARWCAERRIKGGRYITLGLGARRAKKQPSADQVLRWTRRIKDAHGFDTVFMWTPGGSDNLLYPGDDAVAQPVLDAKASWIHPFRGPIAPALGLIWGGRTSVFPDSGLMHFAAASPGGVLGLFAESSVSPPPWRWGPIGPNAEYLEAPHTVGELSDECVLAAIERRLAALPQPLAEAAP